MLWPLRGRERVHVGKNNILRLRCGDDIFNEMIPMVSIELLAPGSSRGFVKSERPDWIDEKSGIGLEVTSAVTPGMGRMMGFYRNNRGHTFEELSGRGLVSLKGALYFRSGGRFCGYVAASRAVKINCPSWSVYINELPDGDFLDLQSSSLLHGAGAIRPSSRTVYLRSSLAN